MTLKEKHQRAIKDNIELIKQIKQILTDKLGIKPESYLTHPKDAIITLLNSITKDNEKALELRLQRARIRDDINDLRLSMSDAPISETPSAPPKSQNPVEAMVLKRMMLKDELSQLVIESNLLEATLEKNHDAIVKFIKLIPQPSYSSVLYFVYVENLSIKAIANELLYSYANVKQIKYNAIRELARILVESE